MNIPYCADFGGEFTQQSKIRLDACLDLHEVDAFQFDPIAEAVDRRRNIDGIASGRIIAITIGKSVAGNVG